MVSEPTALDAAGPSTTCTANPDDCSGAGLLPSLLLIGTRKAGTTALSNLLREHPAIQMPACEAMKRRASAVGAMSRLRARERFTSAAPAGMCVWDKEVRYFSRGISRGLDLCWYRSLYQCKADETGSEPARGVTPRVGFDGSPDYFVLPEPVVRSMSQLLGPRARLIALLRNPADRFYSAFNMGMNEHLMNKRGAFASTAASPPQVRYDEFAGSLDRYLLCAPDCPNEPGVVSMFFQYGLYARHLMPFVSHFGRERLHVEKSEDYYAAPWEVVSRVLRFAGLPVDAPGFEARVRGGSGLSDRARNRGKVWGGDGYAGALAEAERRKLQAWYRPHNLELYQMLQRDFGWENETVPSGAAAPHPTRAEGVVVKRRLRPEL